MYMVMKGHNGGYERRNRVRPTQIGIMLVHNATETVWSRRTRGILAGTKLTRVCRAATGRRGVTVSFERRSLSEEAERARLELESSERSIMAAGVVGTGEER